MKPRKGGYAAHIDSRTKDDVGYTMVIQDCDFESKTGPAVGIGMHKNANLTFINCKFTSDADPNYNPVEGYTNLANWGCIFAHDSIIETATNQKLTFNNCNGVSIQGDRSLWISGTSQNLMVSLFRNIFWAIPSGTPDCILSPNVSYNSMNYGNNFTK